MSFAKEVNHIASPDFGKEVEFLAVGLFEDKGLQASHKAVDDALGGLIGTVIERGDFKGKKGDALPLMGSGALSRVVLIGLGEYDKFTAELARQATGQAVGLAIKQKVSSCSVLAFESDLDKADQTQAIAEGLILGSYRFDDYQKQDDDATILTGLALLGSAEAAGLTRGIAVGKAVCFARDLQNQPANVMTPSRLAEEAIRIGKGKNMKTTVFNYDEIMKMGMLAFAGVAQGSKADVPAKFMVIEYNGGNSGDAPFALVGKGLTFDSGGISLKPGLAMDEMKFDMSGAAVVLGVMEAIAALQPAINIVGAIPSTENMPGGSAQRPGDIVRAYNGKTIEILNTDAEGRLILADAMSYVVDKYKPVGMLDFATLTGAVLIALGHRATGLMSNNDDVVAEVQAASDKTGERVWQLPLWDDYKEDIKSKVADIKNIGDGRLAGTISAGKFLEEFVGDTPWAHLDIAGTAWQSKDQPYTPSGGSGVAVRLVTQLLLDRANQTLD